MGNHDQTMGAAAFGRRVVIAPDEFRHVINVNLNGAGNDQHAPFGGMKQSGNGREWGRFGIDEFVEVKAISGWQFED